MNWMNLWGSNKDSPIKNNDSDEVAEEDAVPKQKKYENENQKQVKSKNESFNTTQSLNAESVAVKDNSTNMSAIQSVSNWIIWGAKSQAPILNASGESPDDGDETEDGEQPPPAIDQEYSEDESTADDNAVEVVNEPNTLEGKSSRKKSSSSWTFWNSTNEISQSSKNDNKAPGAETLNDKQKVKNKLTNTLLKSDTKFSTRKDLLDMSNNHRRPVTVESSPPISSGSVNMDSAILYEPHDNSSQFNKINTHKNENLKESVIVPDWQTCLPDRSTSGIVESLFRNTSTSTANKNSNFMNWRKVLSSVSTKLGFYPSSISMTEKNETPETSILNGIDSNSTKEKYKLYGKCLSKLPINKRACLPNFDRFYELDADELNSNDISPDDADDPNHVHVANDSMGNILINKDLHTSQSKHVMSPRHMFSQKAGPLEKISKVLIIGVHGFFPTKMIRPIIGAPKGTSSKFANEAEKAVLRYCLENNLVTENESHVSIQKIALEKEGKVFDRVEFFKEILTRWETELNEADFIYIASHSQGCVVSIILLAELIRLGILRDPLKKRIGILGMAGINNGPFYGVDKSLFMKAYTAIEHDSLIELFELSKFDSPQSVAYKESIQIIINSNVKVCFIGSINDQLVPLYSALASHVYHPNIYRACYIDHSSQTPLFIQRLVSICCQLQNLGYFENSVLKELSTALAGPLTGGGHSKLYNDGKVYDLGVRFILDTEDIIAAPSEKPNLLYENSNISQSLISRAPMKLPPSNLIHIREFNIAKVGTNNFILPWSLRGLFFNIEKNWPNNTKLLSVSHASQMGRSGSDEIKDLCDLFEDWKPDSKNSKELKFRLSGIRNCKL